MATAERYDRNMYDPESQTMYTDDSDKLFTTEIRNGFIRKVYGILLCQIACTTAVGLLYTYTPVLQSFAMNYPFVASGLPLIVGIVILLVLVCNRDMARRYPTNFILLGVFTIFESLGLGATCAITAKLAGTGNIVLMAFALTFVIFAGLTAFAFQTSYDFTSLVGILYYVVLALIAVGFIKLFFPKSKTMELIYAGGGALIFSLYIVVDTQLLIGRGRLKISEEDYIFAALELYLDFINLFIFLLDILRTCAANNNN